MDETLLLALSRYLLAHVSKHTTQMRLCCFSTGDGETAAILKYLDYLVFRDIQTWSEKSLFMEIGPG